MTGCVLAFRKNASTVFQHEEKPVLPRVTGITARRYLTRIIRRLESYDPKDRARYRALAK